MAEQEVKKYKDKDPAFLFYAQAWLEGTGEMMLEEKGAYIDLLSYQHQKGSLPTEMSRLARLVGVSEEKFIQLWEHIKPKFELVNNRYVNKKLHSLIGERQERAKKNKINGTFAGLIRYSNLTASEKSAAKNSFNFEDFMGYDDENEIYQKVTEWYGQWKESIKDKDKDKDKDNTNTEGGAGETKSKYVDFKNSLLRQQMWCEEVCMKTKSKMADLPSMIDRFISHCIIGGETHYSEKEFKAHFRNVCLSRMDIVKPELSKNAHPSERVDERVDAFRKKVLLYANQYDPKMLEAFFLYWTELDDKSDMLKWEKEKAFEIPKRLAYWKENEKKFKKNGNSGKHTGTEYSEAAAKLWGSRT